MRLALTEHAVDTAPAVGAGRRLWPYAIQGKLRARVLECAMYVALASTIAPSLAWIALDRHVWPWDQAWYGQVSVELFYTLVHTPGNWLGAMMHAFGQKAPGIAWLGQWFVPFGNLFGSTDEALLAAILIVQIASLWVLFSALVVSSNSKLIAFTSTFAVATFPLVIGMAHQYLVEPLQTLAVAWFVYICVKTPTWNVVTVVLNLICATAFAMLVKVTSPLFCFGPGLLALALVWYKLRRARGPAAWAKAFGVWRIGLLVTALLLGSGAVRWYWTNWTTVVDFTMLAYSSPVAQLYGSHDTFVNKLGYWLGAIRANFAYPIVGLVAVVVIALGVLSRLYRLGQRHQRLQILDLMALIAAVEIGVTLAVFSAGDNEENRYLMPLAPYVAVILCWSLRSLNYRWAVAALLAASTVQAVGANLQSFGIISLSDSSPWLTAIDRDNSHAAEIDSIVDQTCTPAARARYTIVGVEEPWFNANTMSYVSAKHHEAADLRCYYTGLGYAETDSERAWNRLLQLNTLYFVTLVPSAESAGTEALNQVSSPILVRVQGSGLFGPVSLADDPAVRAFRRTAN